MSGVILRGADLNRANFAKADLGSVDLRNANLRNANLVGAMMAGANLDGADLAYVAWDFCTCPDGTVIERFSSCCGHLHGAVPSAGCDQYNAS